MQVTASQEDRTTFFDITKESLEDILKQINNGKIQLPDFQRSWKWDDDRITSLLASIALSYPIGAVMLLEMGNSDVRMKTRCLEGVDTTGKNGPERAILDGQQRLTSLFLTLFSERPVDTIDERGNALKRFYYIDIKRALSDQIEDAIISIPDTKKRINFNKEVELDLTTANKEYETECMPLSIVFNISRLTDWQMGYVRFDHQSQDERMDRWKRLHGKIIKTFQQYQIPLIILRKGTPKEAICQVFEKVNTGGIPLNVFELLTATYAADEFNLRDDWEKRKQRFAEYEILKELESTQFLQAISLLNTYNRKKEVKDVGVSCKRKDILRLELRDYKKWSGSITEAFIETVKFLHSQKVFSAKWLPYSTQLVPMATLFAALGKEGEKEGIRKKIADWYWCGIFGEMYGGAVETRFAKDVDEVIAWINGKDIPSTVKDANFESERLIDLTTRTSAAYKGIFTLLLREGCFDFRTGNAIDNQIFFDENIDIHHVFPREYCKMNKQDIKRCDSIINKTPLSSRTNRIIKDDPPSKYLKKIMDDANIVESRMEKIIESHLINISLLKNDEFNNCLDERQKKLFEKIQHAMGK